MKQLLFPLALLLAVLGSTGCGGDDDMSTPGRCDATVFNDDVNPKLMAFQDAATALVNDPDNVSKCENYKTTGDAWLAAIKNFENCTSIYQNWREAVEDARAELAALDCN